MSVKRFKFVSPGVFVNEIDNSQLPAEPTRLGPVIIGRTERGPGMRPVTVKSQADFVEMFGLPIPGGQSGDVWREGNYQSPTYASYAAMAYLRNNGPVTMVRLLGHEHENKADAGRAGWRVSNKAYGLWLYDSSSLHSTPNITGTLAAVWYFDAGVIALSGSEYEPNHLASNDAEYPVESTCRAVKSVGADREFKVTVYEDHTATPTTKVLETTFNFNKNSDKFIRKVFNTNPSLASEASEISMTGDAASRNAKEYWLGQTFEDNLGEHLNETAAGKTIGIILPLENHEGSNETFAEHRMPAKNATTGWVLSQQLSNDSGSFNPKATTPVGCNKLFKIHSLDCGEWESSNLKVSIADVRYSRNADENPYGSFSVMVRKRHDNDSAPIVIEHYSNCNLNPQSPNYIKRKIGDQTLEWDEGDRRYKVVGDYPNQSKFIRIEINGELDNGALDPLLLPFGFQGPPGLNDIVSKHSGDHTTGVTPANMAVDSLIDVNGVAGGGQIMVNVTDRAHKRYAGEASPDATDIFFGKSDLRLKWPKLRCRTSSDQGSLSNRRSAYWGVDTLLTGSSKTTNKGWGDMMFALPDNIALGSDVAPSASFAFSLDDVALPFSNLGVATWAEGNRADGTSYSASGSTGTNGTYKLTLDEGIDKFTMPLWGGFDGLDIKSLDPFAPTRHIGSTDKSSYEYYSVRKAIDTCADAEVVECNLITVPGITTNGINQHLVNVAENRADCLAILDLAGGYSPRADRLATATAFSSYGGSVTSTLQNLTDLGINSSYACSYYPWVQIRDTHSDSVVWVPPSVAAIGTMASSEAKSEVWFAPAGFTRGGLTEGSAGMPVVGVRDRLTSKQRDDLYAQNVNPIATFPAEGIVIFGQKTMQVTASALDRINVRRLMIFVKKEISRMAATTLFEQNVQRTWNRFLGQVNPFLDSVRARLGLTDFKVILDETTTTPELVDRNIMYAKILLKPARAIEFIAIDFVITNSGASFED